MKPEKLWSYALIMFTLLWGWSFTAIHETLLDLSANAFNAYRFLLASLLMALGLNRRLLAMRHSEWIGGGVAGMVLSEYPFQRHSKEPAQP